MIETSGATKAYKNIDESKKKGMQPYFPTDLIRPSCFFPMNPREIGNREIKGTYKVECAWGCYELYGYYLSIKIDEPLMLVLNYLSQIHGSNKFTTSYPQICKLLGKTNNIATKKALYESLKRLKQSGAFIKNEKGRGGVSLIETFWEHKKLKGSAQKVDIRLNPEFIKIFNEGDVTYLNFIAYRTIKGSIAKALFRFLSSHIQFRKSSGIMHIGIEKVADAINLNKDYLSDVKRLIQDALVELYRCKLIFDGRVDDNNVMYVKGKRFTNKEIKEIAEYHGQELPF